jgi:hypothetical protein
MSDSRLAPAAAVVVVTPEQLAELVRDAVQSALAEQSQDSGPILLERAGLARALGVGLSSVDRLRREGMPCVFIGDSPRFLASECLTWLTEHRRVQPDPG